MPAVWSEFAAAADHHAFLHGGAGGVPRIFDAILALLHLGFRGAADADDRDTAGELRQPLLQLLLVVVRSRVPNRRADLRDPAVDLRLLAGAVDDRGIVLGHGDLAGLAALVAWRVAAGLQKKIATFATDL